MSEFYAVAVLYPTKGKTDELLNVMQSLVKYVETEEPNTLVYQITRSLRPDKDGNEELVVIERYKDSAALKEHGSSAAFKKFVETAQKDQLFRKPFDLRLVKEQLGFISRL